MPLVDDPDETIVHDADRCAGCGADLTGASISRVERRQVTERALRDGIAAGLLEPSGNIPGADDDDRPVGEDG
jgi:hypothetical protein